MRVKYTGIKVKNSRGGEFIMLTLNHLLNKEDGCDGFKTGYFKKAGVAVPIGQKEQAIPAADGSGLSKFFVEIGFGFVIFSALAFLVWKKRTRGTVK